MAGGRGPRRGARRPRRVAALAAAAALALAPTPAATDPSCPPLPGAGGAVGEEARRPCPGARSEALLVLPKDASGAIPSDFVLAEGARLETSRFSPVLCATVALVSGPPGLAPADLVPTVPARGVVVANTVYRTAADAPSAPARGAAGTDPYRDLQYGLAASGAEAARAVTDGRGARVALLDSAPDAAHPELGAVRVLPADGDAPAPARHGTLLAGVLAAAEGNGLGIAGIAPGAELVAVPVCRPDALAPERGDLCLLYDVLGGVDRAFEARAQVMTLAIAGPDNPALARALARVDALGGVIVAAAGNDAGDAPLYPAAYPSVVGVGAVDREGHPYAAGNRSIGAEILAPGVEVLSTAPGGAFAFADGTSLAAAHVSGVLALLTAASGDARAARDALFASGFAARSASPRRAALPTACEALARLGRPCAPPGPPATAP